MQQRQPRLGDILDDYCPRERRLTNHAVVAMIGDDIRLTRCTTCEAEHDYKHARVPRLRKKVDAAMSVPVGVPVPRRPVHETTVPDEPVASASPLESESAPRDSDETLAPADEPSVSADGNTNPDSVDDIGLDDPPPPRLEEGPVHRQLIRAQLPRLDGQPPAPRQAPDFTIRQPGGRPNNRFRGRQQRGGAGGSFQGGPMDHGNRPHGQGNANGNVGGNGRSAGPRPSGRPQMPARAAQRQNNGRKRSK